MKGPAPPERRRQSGPPDTQPAGRSTVPNTIDLRSVAHDGPEAVYAAGMARGLALGRSIATNDELAAAWQEGAEWGRSVGEQLGYGRAWFEWTAESDWRDGLPVGSGPTLADLATRRAAVLTPCTPYEQHGQCRPKDTGDPGRPWRCSQCIRALAAGRNLALYGSADFPGMTA